MRVLVTGGAGFIGCNVAAHYARAGGQVVVFDNLQRWESQHNLSWLQTTWPDQINFIPGDVRDVTALQKAIIGAKMVFHLAGQTAVTTSIACPREDFQVNAIGTFNLLEVVREARLNPIIFFASTNKVYGRMEQMGLVEEATRYHYEQLPYGIPETHPLDFHTPYACSKGVADQYTRDYARIYGLRTIVFRLSCIYGPRQFGGEDQGWLAHFCISALCGRPITIYGDGKQVRDICYIDDLLRAFELAAAHIEVTAGQVYNIGGGPANSISIWHEFGPLLERLVGHPIRVQRGGWRQGDQLVYISDVRKARADFGWQPEISVTEGIHRLFNWIAGNLHLFSKIDARL